MFSGNLTAAKYTLLNTYIYITDKLHKWKIVGPKGKHANYIQKQDKWVSIVIQEHMYFG